MATFNDRIIDIVGSTSIASGSSVETFNAAVSELMDMMPPAYLLRYSEGQEVLNDSNTSGVAEGVKIHQVTRNDGTVDRDCKVVTMSQFSAAKDSSSIHFATVNSPVYCIVTSSGTSTLQIAPIATNAQTATMYFTTYPITDYLNTDAITGIPQELEQAIVLRAGIKFLQTAISNTVQDDEDIEMQQMLGAQVASLTEQLKGELTRLMAQKAE